MRCNIDVVASVRNWMLAFLCIFTGERSNQKSSGRQLLGTHKCQIHNTGDGDESGTMRVLVLDKLNFKILS